MTKFEEELSSLPVSKSTNYADYWNKAQLLTVFKDWQPQQALPVVPEFVAKFITKIKKAGNNLTFSFNSKFDECPAKYWNEAIVWRLNHPEEFALAFITGKYEVEKPKLFYIALPKIYGLSDPIFVSKAESGIISEFTKGKDYALKLTEQEIKSLDERYWQFAVPVEVKE